MRLACGVAEREVAEQEARHGGVFDDVFRATHNHGRNAVFFQMPRDQRHCLMADRAVRHKHGGIDIVRFSPRENFRRVGFHRYAMAAVGRCAEEAGPERTDPAFGSFAPKLRERKPCVQVGSSRMRAVVGDVRDAKVVILRAVTIIDREEFGCAIIRCAGALIAF